METAATKEEINRARKEYGSETIEIDRNAKSSIADDGVWVNAWVWLENEEEDDDDSSTADDA